MGRRKYTKIQYGKTARTEWDETALASRREYLVNMLNQSITPTDAARKMKLSRQRVEQLIQKYDIKKDVRYY